MVRYLGHDLAGGLREEFDELAAVPEWVAWVEQTYPRTSRELVLQAFEDGVQVGPSVWAKDVASLLAEPPSARLGSNWSVVRTALWRASRTPTLQGFGRGGTTIPWSFRPHALAIETLGRPEVETAGASPRSPQ
jgi:hypothetical protein